MNNLFFYFFFYFSFIYCKKIDKEQPTFRCRVDELNFISLSPKLANEKKLDYFTDGNEVFKDFNIYLDLYFFEDQIKEYNLENKRDFFINGMNKAIETIKSLLKVKQVQKDYFLSDDDIINKLGINNWDKTKLGDEMKDQNKTFGCLGIDLYIFVKLSNNTELGENNLAAATPVYTDDLTGQPSMGMVFINRDVDYSKQNSLRFRWFTATPIRK